MADQQPAGYVVGWTETGLEVPMLDGPGARAELSAAWGELAEATPQDPNVRWAVYALHEVPGDAVPTADRPPVEMVAVPFETVLDVFLDGLASGAATALGAIRPDAPGETVGDAARAIVDQAKGDPIAVEQLRDVVRRRLCGDIDSNTTEVPVWGGAE